MQRKPPDSSALTTPAEGGSRLLAHLEEKGGKRGIRILLAAVSSLNSGSIPFHQRHGFTECGRFRHICRKKGRCFAVVWLQKELAEGRPINLSRNAGNMLRITRKRSALCNQM